MKKFYLICFILLNSKISVCQEITKFNYPKFISKDIASLLYMNLKSIPDYITDKVIGLKTNTELAFGNRIYSNSNITRQDINLAKLHFNNLSFKWWINENQKNLISLLEESEFIYDNSYPLMQMDISLFKERKDLIDNVKIVKNKKQISTWIKILSEADSIPLEDTKKFINYILNNTSKDSIRLYLGFLNGKPVGTSMAIQHGDIITIHLVAVIKEFRRKGVGYALSCKPLYDFSKQGIKKAFLIATKKGGPLYEKIGFRPYKICHVYLYKNLNKNK